MRSKDEHERCTVADDSGLELAQAVLASQPFSVLLGTRITAFGDGGATLELDVRDELLQQNGYVHGGVLSYAADNALTFAAGSAVGPAVLTSGFSIEYLRPASGPLLRARAETLRVGRARVVCRCDLSSVGPEGEGSLCAVAQGTITVADRPQGAGPAA